MSTRDLVIGIVIGGVILFGLTFALPVLVNAVAPRPGPSVGMAGPGWMAGALDHNHTNASAMHNHCPMMEHDEYADEHEYENETHTRPETTDSASLAAEVASR